MEAATVHSTPDTALLTRWAVQADTGADTFTVLELDRLAAITPANDARAQWEIADARAIEVELLGYDPTAALVTPDADIDDDCAACDGTGMGTYDGAACTMCGGTGEAHDAPLFDEPYDLDDVAFDAYMRDAYCAAVA